jgi:hypothetical protein
MKVRTMVAVAIAVAATATTSESAHAAGGGTCTWAGTPAAPTGTFSVSPGVTNVPSTGPLKFVAVGRLGGGPGCHGTMKWVGRLDAGATCPFSTFRGRVFGLPGVARFVGRGSLDVPSLLYDRKGNLVGVENAEITTQANQSHFLDCTTPQGFTGGWPNMFSSVLTWLR